MYTKLYNSVLPLISKLSKAEIMFLFFLTTVTDKENRFVNDKELQAKMRVFFRKNGIPQPKKYTTSRWLKKLVDIEICTCSTRDKTKFQIRPEFIMSSADTQDARREKLIRSNLEAPFKRLIAKYRAILLSDQADPETPTS